MEFYGGKVTLHHSDAREVLKTFPANSFHACISDPPYAFTSIAKRFGGTSLDDDTRTSENARSAKDSFARHSRGFMGLSWDNGLVAHDPEFWQLVFNVLRPGGHVIAFGGTRTYHRLACAVEQAGFEIRDCIQWLYASGFPKSHDVAKAIDREAGAERDPGDLAGRSGVPRNCMAGDYAGQYFHSAPATAEAAEWEGWGTAIKPACEMIVLARKPLSEATVAANVLRWGCGALNVNACRVETNGEVVSTGYLATIRSGRYREHEGWNRPWKDDKERFADYVTGALARANELGRFPANVVHDGSPEVRAAFPDAPGQLRGVDESFAPKRDNAIYGPYGPRPVAEPRGDQGSAARFFSSFRIRGTHSGKGLCGTSTFAMRDRSGELKPVYPDAGSAARFFPVNRFRDGEGSAGNRYTENGSTNFAALPGARRDPETPSRFFFCAKADDGERLGTRHPTVKPLALMQWLVRLGCVKGGCVLDPFAGTGTTGEACLNEGMQCTLIEREEAYCADISRRMEMARAGPVTRATATAKMKAENRKEATSTGAEGEDIGPLFAFCASKGDPGPCDGGS